jgi:hypothetical protein
VGLNHRPADYESAALPLSYAGRRKRLYGLVGCGKDGSLYNIPSSAVKFNLKCSDLIEGPARVDYFFGGYCVISTVLSTPKRACILCPCLLSRRLHGRMVWVLHDPVDGLGDRCLYHDPGRTDLLAVVGVGDVVRRQIVQGNGRDIAHAPGAQAGILVPFGKEFIHYLQYTFIVRIGNRAVDFAHVKVLNIFLYFVYYIAKLIPLLLFYFAY